MLDPSPIDVAAGLPKATNPVGVSALGQNLSNGLIGAAAWMIGILLITAAIASLVLRARRAAGRERQQVKMLAYAAALTIGVLLVLTFASFGLSFGSGVWDVPVVLGFGVAVPVACAAAILRHGLYEIDRLISRTISYALLTATLAGVFVVVVLVMTRVLPFSSPVAVAASTLAVAALFAPLRGRLQRLIDRRFNRGRYDPEAALAAFTNSLRDEVELDAIREQLMGAVSATVAPVHASIWIRPST
jgi:hypothetical protein